MKTTTEEILKEQLSYAHAGWEAFFKHCATIKNWCLTIWLAVLVAIFTKKIQLEKCGILIIALSPVCLFWFLESVYTSGMLRFSDFQKHIEKKIGNSDLSYNELSDIMLVSWLHSVNRCVKIKTFLKAAFCTEVIVFFYLALIVVSMFLILRFYF
jgi:hypothetical protein